MVPWHYHPIHNDDMFFVAAPTASGHRSGAGEAGHHERAQLNYRGDYHHRHHHRHHHYH